VRIVLCSWDPKAAHDLPECMLYAGGKIMETYQTIEDELPQKEKYRMTYLRNFVSNLYHLYVTVSCLCLP
jgi:hypothetical protein